MDWKVETPTMDWEAEALARVRRARGEANTLCATITRVQDALHGLGGHNPQIELMADAIGELTIIVARLFDLEDRLLYP